MELCIIIRQAHLSYAYSYNYGLCQICRIDERLSVCVADFGLSKDVYSSDYYRLTHNARLPVKWMAPESLHDNIFNEKTDVVRLVLG